MATPARTSTPVPTTSVLSRRKGPSAASGLVGGGGVKVEAPPAVASLPPPCSSFTPVKSPDPKKSKSGQPDVDDGHVDRGCIKRSLCGELDDVDRDVSTPGTTEMDSSLGAQNNAATRLNLFQMHSTYMRNKPICTDVNS